MKDSKREFTQGEVAEHCTAESCWLIAHGKVYDVTNWLDKHPAGAKAILSHAGTDSTEDFEFHSRSAKSLWESFYIGRLEGHSGGCTIL